MTRYTAEEGRDAGRTMLALVRAFNASPADAEGNPEINALLDGCDLRAVVLVFLGAFRDLMVHFAASMGADDPEALAEDLLRGCQAAALAEEAADAI